MEFETPVEHEARNDQEYFLWMTRGTMLSVNWN